MNIVTSSQEDFDEDGFVSGLLTLELDNEVVGVLRTFNDRLADAVVCDSLKTLWGRDYYMENLLGLSFKVSAFSFFQTNIEAVERLYAEALNLAGCLTGKNVFKQFTVIIIPDTYFIIIEELDSVVCDLCIILHDRFTIHVIDFYVPAVFFFGIAV